MNSLSGISSFDFQGYDYILDSGNNPTGKIREFEQIFKEALEREEKTPSPGTEEDIKKDGSSARLLDVCYEMEALFIGTMLDTMRKTVHETNFFGKGIAKDIFSDMLYDEYAKLMAKTDQFGLARQIYQQLRE